MTSRELTSSFDFWSRGHIRMALTHLHIKYGTDIFIQSGVIDIFSEIQVRPPPSWIFRLCKFGYWGVLTVWYLCSVPYWVKIYALVTEIDALMLQTFIYDVTRINFRFRRLVAWSAPHGRDASSCKIWCIYLYQVRRY